MSTTNTQTNSTPICPSGEALSAAAPPKIQDDPIAEFRPIIADIRPTLWDTLPFSSFSRDSSDNTDRIRAYLRSAKLLSEIREQADMYLHQLCIDHVTPSVDPRFLSHPGVTCNTADMRLELANDLLDAAPEFPSQPPLRLRPDVLALPTPELHRRMHASLAGQLDSFLELFFQGLQGLADAKVLGRVVAHTSDACHFHYFRSFLSVDVSSTDEQFNNLNVHYKRRGVKVVSKTDKETRTPYHLTYTFARHSHHVTLYNPRTSRHLAAGVPKPAEAQHVCFGPSWLMPHILLIEGEQVDGLVVDNDLAEKSGEYSITTCRTYNTRMLHNHCITLGSLVLGGWGVQDSAGARNDTPLQRSTRLTHVLKYTGLPFLVRLTDPLSRLIPNRRGSVSVRRPKS